MQISPKPFSNNFHNAIWHCQASILQPSLGKLRIKFSETQYSVSPIYRGRVYRGIGYIAVACWTPFFCPPISRILQTWRPRARYFSRNRGNSLHSIRGRQFFAKSAHRDSLCSCSLETIFAKSTRAYLSMRAGTHTVQRAATLGGTLTPPLCRRVGSS